MVSCSFRSCKNNSNQKNKLKEHHVSFHRFPKKEEQRSQWIRAVNRANWEPNATSVVCSAHFKAEDFTTGEKGLKLLRPLVIPRRIDSDVDMDEDLILDDVPMPVEIPISIKKDDPAESDDETLAQAAARPSKIEPIDDSDTDVTDPLELAPKKKQHWRKTETKSSSKVVNAYKRKIKAMRQQVRRDTEKREAMKERLAALKKENQALKDDKNYQIVQVIKISRIEL